MVITAIVCSPMRLLIASFKFISSSVFVSSSRLLVFAVMLSGSVGVSFKLVGVFDGVLLGVLEFLDCARVMALVELVCGVSIVIKNLVKFESILFK